ncbi:hypothetical protein BJ973_004390 [Actinoplanes tereljensis]|uniref:Uncharacterized protein n=1 Tax=Paractinoplanes tereljensis TaxID=571912 RepID=A0A919TVX1_9ACTN|nr:DUF6082 family protein [Actinoplanes tereljensis]GIF23779.1 hypothetical protein Ate02nite_65090 [Actinoplanes tereljensis]
MRVDESVSGRSLTPRRTLVWVASAAAVLTAAVVAAGLGMVALIGQSGDDSTWTRWSDVGQAFGVVNSVVAALAVAALVITSMAHARGQRDQQTEISVRHLHVTLTRMAIDNPHLAEVWPRTTPEDSVTQSQHMYANLLLQHAWLQYTTGVATREELVSNLRFLFASPKVRAFWGKTTSSRQSIYVQDTKEASLAAVADEIWREYEAVLACSGENESISPVSQSPTVGLE